MRVCVCVLFSVGKYFSLRTWALLSAAELTREASASHSDCRHHFRCLLAQGLRLEWCWTGLRQRMRHRGLRPAGCPQISVHHHHRRQHSYHSQAPRCACHCSHTSQAWPHFIQQPCEAGAHTVLIVQVRNHVREVKEHPQMGAGESGFNAAGCSQVCTLTTDHVIPPISFKSDPPLSSKLNSQRPAGRKNNEPQLNQ